MNIVYLVLIILLYLILLLIFLNPKNRILKLIKLQFSIFYNNKTKRVSWYDLLVFLLFPIFLTSIICFGFNIYLTKEIIEILLTIISIVFAIIFSAFSFNSAKELENNTKKIVSRELNILLFTESELTVIEIVLLILHYLIYDFINLDSNSFVIFSKILSFIEICICFFILNLIFITIKRLFLLKLSVNNENYF